MSKHTGKIYYTGARSMETIITRVPFILSAHQKSPRSKWRRTGSEIRYFPSHFCWLNVFSSRFQTAQTLRASPTVGPRAVRKGCSLSNHIILTRNRSYRFKHRGNICYSPCSTVHKKRLTETLYAVAGKRSQLIVGVRVTEFLPPGGSL